MSTDQNQLPLLIVARLLEFPDLIGYGTGLENWLQTGMPHVQLLDLDAKSDSEYVGHVLSTLQESKIAVIWINSENSVAPLGSVASLLEFALRNPDRCLMVLQGRHFLIERLGKAGKGNFIFGGDEETLKLEVKKYFEILPA